VHADDGCIGAGNWLPAEKDFWTEVIGMNKRDDLSGPVEAAGVAGGEGPGGAASQPAPPREIRKRRKVSLIAAIVVNVVTMLTVAIILLAVLMPGYRRSFTMARAVEGSEDVWVVVRTSEAQMRDKSTDFISAQDGLKNAMQELVGSGGDNVRAYVRDNFPDQAWINENLPDNMRQWLEQLFPKPQESQQESQEEAAKEPTQGQQTPAEQTPKTAGTTAP
jgi:hypothetical protein